MQIRPKAYLHLIWLWRSLRDSISPHHGDACAEASQSLTYAAVVLTFLLAVLEVDAHRDELKTLGLVGSDWATPAVFLSP